MLLLVTLIQRNFCKNFTWCATKRKEMQLCMQKTYSPSLSNFWSFIHVFFLFETSRFFFLFFEYSWKVKIEIKRFQFYVEVYWHKSFTSSNLLFQLEDLFFRQSHILPMGRVGSQRAKGTLYRLVKDSKITIWVPCEDSNLKQSAQTRRSQLGGGFRALHSVLVYFHVPRRGAVQIAHTSVSPSGTSA